MEVKQFHELKLLISSIFVLGVKEVLKVSDLRNELEKRGLDKNGTKAILMQRLEQAIKDEGCDPRTYTFSFQEFKTPMCTDTSKDISTSVDDSSSDITEKETTPLNVGVEKHETIASHVRMLSQDDGEESDFGLKIVETEDSPVAGGHSTNSSDIANNITECDSKDEDTDANSPIAMNSTKESAKQDSNLSATISTSEPDKKQDEKCQQKHHSSAIHILESDLASSLWVRNISNTTKAADLKSLFSKHAKVVAAKIFTTKNKLSPTCFGYVTLVDDSAAELCIQKLNRFNFKGRVISVEKASNSPLSVNKKTSSNFQTIKKTDVKTQSATSSTNKPVIGRTDSENPSCSVRTKGLIAKTKTTSSDHLRSNSIRDTRSDSIRPRIPSHRGFSTYKRPNIVYSGISRGAARNASARLAFGRNRNSSRGSSFLYSRRPMSGLNHLSLPTIRAASPTVRPNYFRDEANDTRGEMARYKEEMKRREEEHRRREEELRLQRERERIKYEREKLAREKLEIEQLKLTAQLAASAQLQAQLMQPSAGMLSNSGVQQGPNMVCQTGSTRRHNAQHKDLNKSKSSERTRESSSRRRSRSPIIRHVANERHRVVSHHRVNKPDNRSRSSTHVHSQRQTSHSSPRVQTHHHDQTREKSFRGPIGHASKQMVSNPYSTDNMKSDKMMEYRRNDGVRGRHANTVGNNNRADNTHQRFNSPPRNYRHNAQHTYAVDERRRDPNNGDVGHNNRLFSRSTTSRYNNEGVGEFAPRTDPSYASRMLTTDSFGRVAQPLLASDQMFNPYGSRSGETTGYNNLPSAYQNFQSGNNKYGNVSDPTNRMAGRGNFEAGSGSNWSNDNSYTRQLNEGWSSMNQAGGTNRYSKHATSFQGNKRYNM